MDCESIGISDKPVKKSLMSCFGVLVVALPGEEGGVLKGASEAKGNWPREWSVFDDFGEVAGGLFWGLAAGEEDYAGEFRRDMVFEGFGGFSADFCWGGLSFIFFAGENHVNFEEASAEINSGISELFEEAIEDFAGDFVGLE